MSKKTKHVRINPIARAPILRKGGEHRKTRSAERQADKRQLRKLVSRIGGGQSAPDAIWGLRMLLPIQ